MTDFLPYFAGLITLLFGIAFSYAITNGWMRWSNYAGQ
jgi:hypothetical protein